MKWIAVMLFGTVALLGASSEVSSNKSFRGEIMDTQCAKMGSHDVMMKKEGAHDPVECTHDCFKMGGKYVLYDRGTKGIYQLDHQKKFEPFAGQEVEVLGNYEGSTNTIYVTGIERVASPSQSSKK